LLLRLLTGSVSFKNSDFRSGFAKAIMTVTNLTASDSKYIFAIAYAVGVVYLLESLVGLFAQSIVVVAIARRSELRKNVFFQCVLATASTDISCLALTPERRRAASQHL